MSCSAWTNGRPCYETARHEVRRRAARGSRSPGNGRPGTGSHRARPPSAVRGGGRVMDAGRRTAGIAKRQIDGLRITDQPTLDVVVAVLAGAVNTRLVAALGAAGVAAVGLTGADGLVGLSATAPPHRAVD